MKKQKFINFILVFVMLFTYFSPFFEIFDVKAEEQIIEEVSRGKYYIDGIDDEDNYLINLKPHEKTIVTLETEENYYIQDCGSSNIDTVTTVLNDGKTCELIANNYGKVLITLSISNSDNSSVVEEYFYVDVELDKYMENILAKIPDVVYSYDEYNKVYSYGLNYNIQNEEYKGNKRTFDFIISYEYPIIENHGNHVSPYIKSKKLIHDYSKNYNIPNIMELDKGDKGSFYLSDINGKYTDYIWVSENNDVVTVDQNGNYEAIGEGKTNIKFYNKKTFEYINSEVTVIESEFDSIDDLKKKLANSEITVDINHENNLYNFYYDTDSKYHTIYNYVKKLFENKMALNLYFFNTIQNLNCDENSCDFTIEYNEIQNNYNKKEINIENLKINYTGIYIKNIDTVSLNGEFNIDYVSYLPDNTEYTVVYDSKYINKLDNGNYEAIKSGTTKITVIASGSSGYSDTIPLKIAYSENEYEEFNNYLLNLKNVELPYSGLLFESQEELKVLENLLSTKIINDYPNQNIKNILNAEVSCLTSESCYVKLYENKTNSLIGNEWTKYLININYTGDDLNTVEEIININETLNNPIVVPVEKIIKIENSCLDEECFSNKLIENTTLNEIRNNSSLQINYSKKDIFEFKKFVKGGVNYLITISKDGTPLFSKEVPVYSNYIVDMDSKLNKNDRSKYLKEYVDKVLDAETSNTLLYDNVYEVTNGFYKFNLILDQKDHVPAQSININERLYELKKGDTKNINYTLYPSNSTTSDVDFIVEDESVITIDKDGVITAKSKGYTFVECKVGYSSTKILVTVDMEIKEVLNGYLKLIKDHQILTYETVRNHPDSLALAIESTASFYSNGTWLPLGISVKQENGKMYAAVKYNINYSINNYVTSDYKEITYELKGISLDKYKYEMTTGSTVDTKLFFSEGDNNNLLFTYNVDGVVELRKDGTLKALKPGITTIFITDKYSKYFNYIDVVVDKDKCLDYVQEQLNKNTIKINGSSNSFNDSYGEFQSAALSEFENKYRTYLPNTQIGIDCNEKALRCTYTIYKQNSAEVERNIVFNVEKVGIFLDQKTVEIDLNESIDISYTQFNDNSQVKVTSLNKDICEIKDGKIIGKNVGFCTVKYKSDKYFNYQHIFVSKDKIISGYKKLLDDKLSEPIEIPLLNFNMENIKVNENMTAYTEIELYQATIRNKVKNLLGTSAFEGKLGTSSYYNIWPRFKSINDLSEVQIELNLTFNFQDYKNEYYYNNNDFSGETLRKEIEVIPTEIDSKALELGSKLIKNTKQKYDLDLVQYLKYRLSGETWGLFNYSEFYENLTKECPKCSYMLTQGGGGGDNGSVSEGGTYIIFKDDNPIMIFNTTVTASIEVLQDIETYTEEEYINLLKKIVKEAYLKAKKEVTPVATVSSVSYKLSRLSDDINVEIEKSFDSMSKQMLYDVTVEDINFKAPIKTQEEENLKYTYSVTSITPDKQEIILDKGTNAVIGYNITPDNATNKEVTFKSSDESIVKVDSKGNISAIKAGTAYITITSKDKNASTNVKVIVNEKEVANIEVKLGDINCDGKINMTDIIRLRKYFAGKETLNNQGLKNADINKDGKVNMTDIIKLRKYLAGKEKI